MVCAYTGFRKSQQKMTQKRYNKLEKYTPECGSKPRPASIKKALTKDEGFLSERPDSNGRPLAPHARMLANCTTPRLLKAVQK